MIRNFSKIKCIVILLVFNITSNIVKAQETLSPGFTTYTQSAWAVKPKHDNPGGLLEHNFKRVFPFGLTIGSINKISFNSAKAIREFLPQEGNLKKLLPGTLINPSINSYSSELASQLIAATLNIQFDKQIATFSPSTTRLKDLKVMVQPFFNWTIEEVIIEANSFIGGKTSNYTANDFYNILKVINEGPENGNSMNSIFALPMVFSTNVINVKSIGEHNGIILVNSIVGGMGAPYTYKINGDPVNMPINNLSAGLYMLEVYDNKGLSAKKTIIVSDPSTIKPSSTILITNTDGYSPNIKETSLVY